MKFKCNMLIFKYIVGVSRIIRVVREFDGGYALLTATATVTEPHGIHITIPGVWWQ